MRASFNDTALKPNIYVERANLVLLVEWLSFVKSANVNEHRTQSICQGQVLPVWTDIARARVVPSPSWKGWVGDDNLSCGFSLARISEIQNVPVRARYDYKFVCCCDNSFVGTLKGLAAG